MGGRTDNGVPRRSPPDDVSDELGVEPGGNRGPGCPGLCGRQGTWLPVPVRLTKGLPMGAL